MLYYHISKSEPILLDGNFSGFWLVHPMLLIYLLSPVCMNLPYGTVEGQRATP
jgi:hypothetical protein